MANITISEPNQTKSSDLFAKISHFMSAVFTKNAAQTPNRNLGSLDDHTLADIGLRRDELPLNHRSINANDQRFYWVS